MQEWNVPPISDKKADDLPAVEEVSLESFLGLDDEALLPEEGEGDEPVVLGALSEESSPDTEPSDLFPEEEDAAPTDELDPADRLKEKVLEDMGPLLTPPKPNRPLEPVPEPMPSPLKTGKFRLRWLILLGLGLVAVYLWWPKLGAEPERVERAKVPSAETRPGAGEQSSEPPTSAPKTAPVAAAQVKEPPPVETGDVEKATVEAHEDTEPAAPDPTPAPQKVVAPPPQREIVEASPPVDVETVSSVPEVPKSTSVSEPAVEGARKVVAPQEKANFVLQVGAFLSPEHLRAAEARVGKLGWVFHVLEREIEMPMHRVEIVDVPHQLKGMDLKQFQQHWPATYRLRNHPEAPWFLGSFVREELALKEILNFERAGGTARVVTVRIPRTLKVLRAGAFATQEEAENAADRLGQSGPRPLVVKRLFEQP